MCLWNTWGRLVVVSFSVEIFFGPPRGNVEAAAGIFRDDAVDNSGRGLKNPSSWRAHYYGSLGEGFRAAFLGLAQHQALWDTPEGEQRHVLFSLPN